MLHRNRTNSLYRASTGGKFESSTEKRKHMLLKYISLDAPQIMNVRR